MDERGGMDVSPVRGRVNGFRRGSDWIQVDGVPSEGPTVHSRMEFGERATLRGR